MTNTIRQSCKGSGLILVIIMSLAVAAGSLLLLNSASRLVTGVQISRASIFAEQAANDRLQEGFRELFNTANFVTPNNRDLSLNAFKYNNLITVKSYAEKHLSAAEKQAIIVQKRDLLGAFDEVNWTRLLHDPGAITVHCDFIESNVEGEKQIRGKSNYTCNGLNKELSVKHIILGNLFTEEIILSNVSQGTIRMVVLGDIRISSGLILSGLDSVRVEIIASGKIELGSLVGLENTEVELLFHSSSGGVGIGSMGVGISFCNNEINEQTLVQIQSRSKNIVISGDIRDERRYGCIIAKDSFLFPNWQLLSLQ